jgi:predicted KAP-like P-loop ATPase
MWSDNETGTDFLNFRFIADIAAEMISQADGRPLSMGVSGSWGVGKSSMMRLLAASLRERSADKFLFVEFNAWLYQGYDDTRSALMETISAAVLKRAEEDGGLTEDALEKAKGLLSRVNWFRVATSGAKAVASMAMGLPPVGLIGDGIAAASALADGNVSQSDIDKSIEVVTAGGKEAKALLRERKIEAQTPPKAIHDFRTDLESTLKSLNLTLVVLIDDLDRCLPSTTISTLEAMRLFLFLDRTAFIIAADDEMIKQSVKYHFKDIAMSDDLVTNYFDKLIQVPIRVPSLGTQDVRAYLMMLFVENSSLKADQKNAVRAALCERLGQTWSGKRVDRAFVSSLIPNCPDDLNAKLDMADRLAPLLTSASKISGNPRLIKRFLNTLSIRMTIARAQNVSVDESALAKMLLFERCGSEKTYGKLLSAINESMDGKAQMLVPLEAAARTVGSDFKFPEEWADEFSKEWLTLEPALSDIDLRGAVFVSRENTPIVTSTDRLSNEAADILEALLKTTSNSPSITSKLQNLSPKELQIIAASVLSRARSINQWGTPPIIHAMLSLAQIDGDHGNLIVNFFKSIPPTQLEAAVVPLLSDKAWAEPILATWAKSPEAKDPVKKAIASASKRKASNGNVGIK